MNAGSAQNRSARRRPEALGRLRGGFSTKIHPRAEGGGKPMTFVLSGGSATSRCMWNPFWSRGVYGDPVPVVLGRGPDGL